LASILGSWRFADTVGDLEMDVPNKVCEAGDVFKIFTDTGLDKAPRLSYSLSTAFVFLDEIMTASFYLHVGAGKTPIREALVFFCTGSVTV